MTQWLPFLAPIVAWVSDRTPAFIDGFLGGIVGALVVERWHRMRKRKSEQPDLPG